MFSVRGPVFSCTDLKFHANPPRIRSVHGNAVKLLKENSGTYRGFPCSAATKGFVFVPIRKPCTEGQILPKTPRTHFSRRRVRVRAPVTLPILNQILICSPTLVVWDFDHEKRVVGKSRSRIGAE
jgi:hypothetical protein